MPETCRLSLRLKVTNPKVPLFEDLWSNMEAGKENSLEFPGNPLMRLNAQIPTISGAPHVKPSKLTVQQNTGEKNKKEEKNRSFQDSGV